MLYKIKFSFVLIRFKLVRDFLKSIFVFVQTAFKTHILFEFKRFSNENANAFRKKLRLQRDNRSNAFKTQMFQKRG